jgi:ABC-type branched-subunit amino acid transport system permease subunit
MSMRPKYLWRYVVAIITLLLLPLVVGPYSHFLLATILVYFLVAQSLSLLVGVGGQWEHTDPHLS